MGRRALVVVQVVVLAHRGLFRRFQDCGSGGWNIFTGKVSFDRSRREEHVAVEFAMIGVKEKKLGVSVRHFGT